MHWNFGVALEKNTRKCRWLLLKGCMFAENENACKRDQKDQRDQRDQKGSKRINLHLSVATSSFGAMALSADPRLSEDTLTEVCTR
jgi:hypothetical protein